MIGYSSPVPERSSRECSRRAPGVGPRALRRLSPPSGCAAVWRSTLTRTAYADPVLPCLAGAGSTRTHDQLHSLLLVIRHSLCGFWLGARGAGPRAPRSTGPLPHSRNLRLCHGPAALCGIGPYQPVCRSFAALSADITSSCLAYNAAASMTGRLGWHRCHRRRTSALMNHFQCHYSILTGIHMQRR